MSANIGRVMLRCLIFGMIGLLFEVFFTAAGAARHGNWNLHGQTSPWMMLDYGLLGLVLMPMATAMIRRKIPLALRAIVYMLGIFFVEFVSGWVFDLFGLKIWDYHALPWNLCGYITLLYAPLWYALGLGAETLYRKVDMASLAIIRGLTAEDIEHRSR
jgi:uncharacterized membrane protein